MRPRVSVIFPVHRREAYLREAIDSIRAQTLPDFEFIVVDDGSGPALGSLLDAVDDPRIRLIRFPMNLGVNAARNAGLTAATAPYIALMDSDDVALPQRLATQLAWLEAHPELTVCGSRAIKLLPDGRREPMLYPETDALIKARLLWADAALLNPTVMFRTDFVRRNRLFYDANFPVDQDHAFFIAMMQAGASFSCLSEPLLLYRRHAQNATSDETHQDEGKTALRTRLLPLFFPSLTGEEGQLMLKLLRRRLHLSVREACSVIAAADRAMRETRSFYGEDRAEINRMLEAQVQALMGELTRAQAPVTAPATRHPLPAAPAAP